MAPVDTTGRESSRLAAMLSAIEDVEMGVIEGDEVSIACVDTRRRLLRMMALVQRLDPQTALRGS
jgi:protein-arginine kinase